MDMLNNSINKYILKNALVVNSEGAVLYCGKNLLTKFNIERKIINSSINEVFPESNLLELFHDNKSTRIHKYKINDKVFLSIQCLIEKYAVEFILNENEIDFPFVDKEMYTEKIEDLNGIMESSYDGIVISNSNYKIVNISKSYARLTGYSEEFINSVIGKNVKELKAKGLISEIISDDVIESKKSISKVQKLSTGKEVFITGNPVYGEDKSVKKIITNIRDLSHLKRLEGQLKEEIQSKKAYKEKLNRLSSEIRSTFVANSTKMLDLIDDTHVVAKTNAPVLITGESGVGKEVVANYIHRHSERSSEAFTEINCASFNDNLLEAELFGYTEGSFTNAAKGGKKGFLEIADKGTLLLDEIGELSLSLQPKLLRVLEKNDYYRVGSTEVKYTNARFIFTSNKDLKKEVERKQFREDLYYRISVMQINVPPLRERIDDILPLANYFINYYNYKYNRLTSLTKDAAVVLRNYDWPGNVRELKNVIERLVVANEKDLIDSHCIEKRIYSEIPCKNESQNQKINYSPLNLKQEKEKVEIKLIKEALAYSSSIRSAAKSLKIDHSTLLQKMKKHNIQK
jgi:PAS domain S-box-containing protein